MKKFLLSVVAVCAAILPFSANAENFQLRGSINNWLNKVDQETISKFTFKPGDVADTWVLSDVGVFYWVNNDNNNNRFKIVETENGDKWLTTNSTTMEKDTEYQLGEGGDAGFNVPLPRYVSKIIVTKKDGKYFMSYEYQNAKYIYGDKIAGESLWSFDKPSGAVLVERFDEELNKNVFYGHIVMGATGDGKCYWRIADKPSGDAQFHWGFNGTANAEQEQASFEAKKGSTHCYVTEPEQSKLYTLYEVKFYAESDALGTVLVKNIGSYSEVPSGVEGVEKDAAKVIGGQGEIRVEGFAGQFAVYSYSGALVATGCETVNVPAGMYIVLANGVATKVVVR